MGRSPCCDESGLKKGPWTPEEDDKLIKYIHKHGHGSWRALPKLAGLNRCGKSCRLRWTNYLRPDIRRGNFTQEEEQTILNLHAVLGNKWSAIATHLPGRTDNEIKNFWNTHLKKKLIQMGFDPMTHRPRTDVFSALPHLVALATLIENPAAWEEQAARLQAEAARMARLNHYYLHCILQPTLTPISLQNATVFNPNIPTLPDVPTFDLSSHHEPQLPPEMSVPFFSHLPDLEAGVETDYSSSKGGDVVVDNINRGGESSMWLTESVSPAANGAALVTEISVSNAGDACSTSSYGGADQLWSELFDDPFFQEIA